MSKFIRVTPIDDESDELIINTDSILFINYSGGKAKIVFRGLERLDHIITEEPFEEIASKLLEDEE